MKLIYTAACLLCSLLAVQSLKFERTDSFSSILFNWTGDCNDTYSLNCSSSSMVPIIGINGFKPLEASPFNCFFKLFGFSANTTYTCALQSNGSFQEDVTVRTLSEAPSEPQNIRVYEITWSCALLDWDPPAENRDSIAGYNVYIGTSSSANTTTSTSISLFLNPSLFYTIQVAAWYYRSDTGTSADGPQTEVSFSTPTNAPQNLRVVNDASTTSSCFFIWSPPSTNANLITIYHVRRDGSEIANVADTFYNVTGLVAGQTTYGVTVTASTSHGIQTSSSSSRSCSTRSLSAVPSTPQNLMVSTGAATTSSCFLNWSPPAINSHLVTGYHIRYSSGTSNVGIVTVYNLTGLNPGTSYTVYLSAYYNAGTISTSEISSFLCRTKKSMQQPYQPVLQTVPSSSRLQGTATIRWSHSSSSLSSIIDNTPTHFDISFYPVHDLSGSASLRRKATDGNLRNTTITGLEPNSSYQITLLARNSAGSSNAASEIVPPYLPDSSPEVVASRQDYMQLLLLLSGSTNCTTWLNNLKRNELAHALFDRLRFICPGCGDFLPRSNYLDSYNTHCSRASNLVLFQAKVTASASCGDCNFNVLLEYLVSLSSAYIVATGSTLLIVSSCPLYVSSLTNTGCLSSSLSSSASVVGGTIGGIIAGAVLASVIAAIVVVVLIFYQKKRGSLMMKKELSPHPTSHTYHGKRVINENAEDEDYYEDIPMFGSAPKKVPSENEDDYEDPKKLNIPKTISVSGGYEIPDCIPQNTPNKTKAGKKERSKSKNLKGKKDSSFVAAVEGGMSPERSPTSEQGNSNPRTKGKKVGYIRAVDASKNVQQSGRKEERETVVTSPETNMYSHAPAAGILQQPLTSAKEQDKKTPLMPTGGKKLLKPTAKAAGGGGGGGGGGGRNPTTKPKPKTKDKPIPLKTNAAYHTHLRD